NPLDIPEPTKHSGRVAFPRVCRLYVIGNDLNPRIEKLIEGRNG
ncbi:15791_t:CDS:2, partial [Rhizophagus irregularis]